MLNMALPSFPCVGFLEYISIPLKDYNVSSFFIKKKSLERVRGFRKKHSFR